jgi:hypothetical protein
MDRQCNLHYAHRRTVHFASWPKPRCGFEAILLLIVWQLLLEAITGGIHWWQGSCDDFRGDHWELNFQSGPGWGARGTPYAKDTA